VVGRPVLKASDRKAAVEKILEEITMRHANDQEPGVRGQRTP